MKVRMLQHFGSVNGNYRVGEELDLDKEEAAGLCEAGYAEPVGKAPAKRASTRKAAPAKSGK